MKQFISASWGYTSVGRHLKQNSVVLNLPNSETLEFLLLWNDKIISFLPHNCNVATVITHNINI